MRGPLQTLSTLFRRAYSTPSAQRRIVALALGSNVGDRVANIEGALSYLEQTSDVRIVDTSFLYETAPMYIADQPKFINGACLISTALEPQSLINLLKDAESHQGRTPTFRNGPRVVDLDILFDENKVYNLNQVLDRELTVPHPSIQTREFVLRPLADIVPNFRHPVLKQPVAGLLSRIQEESAVQRTINFPAPSSISTPTTWALGKQTYIMATLNTTPDSFSDGGEHNSMTTGAQYSLKSLQEGANMIDVGGYSTRPGSSIVSISEELGRTVPYIERLREEGAKGPISVDTFRADVAEKCLEAGANCINDVYGLTGPHEGVANTLSSDIVQDESGVPISDGGAMLRLAARAKVPVIIMHSRGPANKNKDYSMYKGGVLEGVSTELRSRVERALKGGVRRWNIIIDPGIGFSKTVEDNVKLIRHHSLLSASSNTHGDTDTLPSTPCVDLSNFPTLVGTSRKRYLGELTDREEARKVARTRDWATAAAVTSAIQQGADIVRIHDTQMGHDVVKVADAIWRGN